MHYEIKTIEAIRHVDNQRTDFIETNLYIRDRLKISPEFAL